MNSVNERMVSNDDAAIAKNEMQDKSSWVLHIRLSALIRMAAANLRYKKLRSSLTIIGIAIGIGSVFLLMSFGLGLQELVATQVSQGSSINTIDVNTTGSRILKVDDGIVKGMEKISNVEHASGYFAKAGKLNIDGASADVVVYGVDKLYIETSNMILLAGANVDPSVENQIVLSNTILEAVGISDYKQAINMPVTATIKFGDNESTDKKLTVVGVISSGNGTEAFVSQKLFVLGGENNFAGAKVQVKERQFIADVRKAIESLGYTTASPVDTLEQVDQFFRILRVILVSFGTIGMVIAILGMINTLTVSLLERIREVALMNALGARPRDMKNLFILEAVLLAMIGGILGIVGALIFGVTADTVLNRLAMNRGATTGFSVFSSPVWLVAVTILFMALVGYLVAIVPARRAAKVKPVEALRRE